MYSNSNEEIEPKVLHVGLGSEFFRSAETSPSTIIWEQPNKIGELQDIAICYASDIHAPFIPSFKSPEVVKEIHFDGKISQVNFDKLIQPMTNLKLLEIHISSLEHLNLPRRTGFLFYLHLPNLESLQISSHNFTSSHTANLKIDTISNNCCCLLKKLFPSLNFLAVSLPLFRSKDSEITESILKSIKLHRKTLKSLNVETTFDIEKLFASNQSPIPIEETEIEKLNDVQLHSFHYFSTFNTESTIFWRKFLKSQTKLEYVQFWCGDKYYPLPTYLILRNFQNLHTIAVNINPDLGSVRGTKRTSIDCAAFKKCSLLKTLVLKKKPAENSENNSKIRNNNKTPDFTNFHHLPKGLEHLRLIHLNLTKQDSSIIAREMVHLTRLYLENTGTTGDFGMTFEDLAYLLGRAGREDKILHSIDIHDGLNQASFDCIGNFGGFASVAKILFKTHKPQSFKAVLNANGEYDILEDSELDKDEVVIEDEIFHDDFQAEVTENDLHDDLHVAFEDDVNEVQVLFSENENKLQRINMLQRSVVKPIELPHPTASRYIKSRQKYMKQPNQPTIHESAEENANNVNISNNGKSTTAHQSGPTKRVKDAQTEAKL